jgi:hypothetical protein
MTDLAIVALVSFLYGVAFGLQMCLPVACELYEFLKGVDYENKDTEIHC